MIVLRHRFNFSRDVSARPQTLRPMLPPDVIAGIQNLSISGDWECTPQQPSTKKKCVPQISLRAELFLDLKSLRCLTLVNTREIPILLSIINKIDTQGTLSCPLLEEITVVYSGNLYNPLIQFLRERKEMECPMRHLIIVHHNRLSLQPDIDDLLDCIEVDEVTVLPETAAVCTAGKFHISLILTIY